MSGEHDEDREPAVVLLPGLDGTGTLFRRLREVATLATTVLAYDPEHTATYDELVDRVAERLPTRRPFVLLGESFSGPVAVRVAARRPPELCGVVLCNAFVTRPVCRCAGALPWSVLFRMRPPCCVLRWVLVGREASDELCREVRRAVNGVSRRVLAARVRETVRVDARRELEAIAVPVLDLRGARDRLVRPRSAAPLTALAGRLETARIDGPHLLLQARPQEAWREIERFARRCAGA